MLEKNKDIEVLLKKIEEADAIVVGGASGMSAAAGYSWYQKDDTFLKYFGNFADRYGIDNIFGGFYYRFSTEEERWAYIATLIKFVEESPVGNPYLNLKKLIENKKYFIVTTNQDTQFSKAFPQDKVSPIQGDWRYLQCSRCCHDKIYDNHDIVDKLYKNIEGTKVPSELIPRCPQCGGSMEPWVRSYVFLEGSQYKEEYRKYHQFLQENMHKKILFLELGVGRMTPMFIQEPFWSMTYRFSKAFYITINPNDAILPEDLEEKGYAIRRDIADVLEGAVKSLEEKADADN